MNNTITLTNEQMKALSNGQSITIEPPKPFTKWEPKGGTYSLSSSFEVITFLKQESSRLAGMEYQTQQQAEQSAKALRSYARQLNWISENDDGWVADWNNHNQPKYCCYLDHDTNTFTFTNMYYSSHLNSTYMSKQNAIKLAQLLNDGIVEFWWNCYYS